MTDIEDEREMQENYEGEFDQVEFLDQDSTLQPDPDPFLDVAIPDFEEFECTSVEEVTAQCFSSKRSKNSSQIKVTLNLSASDYRKYKFHFVGVCYVRNFKTQHLSDPVCKKNIFGDTVPDLFDCLWNSTNCYVSREVIVEQLEEEKNVKWSSKEIPDVSDMTRFIVLKHEKTKRLCSPGDLKDNEKVLSNWRGKDIQVQIYRYSTSITSNTLWDMVKRKLLHPERKDRAGAPSNEEVFSCVQELKEVHAYTALHCSWEKWANFILAQPGDRRARLMSEAPPDEYLHLFRTPPISEGSQLQCTRQGLQVAHNINDSVAGSVDKLCGLVDTLCTTVLNVQMQLHELQAQVKRSRELLFAMQSSLPPVESEFSRKLASRVTDMEDIDHQE